jgi:hypothetical protein
MDALRRSALLDEAVRGTSKLLLSDKEVARSTTRMAWVLLPRPDATLLYTVE